MTTATATTAVAATIEREIRAAASGIIAAVTNRRHHPTFGYTKASIRTRLDQLDGMAFLYGVLTDQGLNPLPGLVEYADPATTERVAAARAAVAGM
jgi:hypothetical protein